MRYTASTWAWILHASQPCGMQMCDCVSCGDFLFHSLPKKNKTKTKSKHRSRTHVTISPLLASKDNLRLKINHVLSLPPTQLLFWTTEYFAYHDCHLNGAPRSDLREQTQDFPSWALNPLAFPPSEWCRICTHASCSLLYLILPYSGFFGGLFASPSLVLN